MSDDGSRPPGGWDLSKLHRAWLEHYYSLGLGHYRANGYARKKTMAHKVPPGKSWEKLARWDPKRINYLT